MPKTIRVLLSQWRYSLLILLSLGCGLGVSLLFSTVTLVTLLNPLPFPDPDELVLISKSMDRKGYQRVGHLRINKTRALDESSTSFDGVGVFNELEMVLGDHDSGARAVSVGWASASFFKVLGMTPLAGRTFNSRDEVIGAVPVALVRRDYWRSHFGEAPLGGQQIRLSKRTYTVVGILPSDFVVTSLESKIWIPMKVEPERERFTSAPAIARLRRGMTLQAAEAEIASLLEEDESLGAHVISIQDALLAEIRSPLIGLTAASLVLLAMMCFNVVVLVLLRTEALKKHYAIHRALGVSRWREIRRLAGENLVLCLAGSALAVAVALAGLPLLKAMLPVRVPRIDQVSILQDGFGVLLGVTLGLTVLLTGLSALFAAEINAQEVLKMGGVAGSMTPRSKRFRRGALALETAAALVLIHAGLLLAESFRKLSNVDPGFDHTQVWSVHLRFPPGSSSDFAAHRIQLTQLLERVRSSPGIVSAGLASSLPFFSGRSEMTMLPEGYSSPSGEMPVLHFNIIDIGCFETLGMRLVQGRFPDDPGQQPVVLVNESFARNFFPELDNIVGRKLRAIDEFRIEGVVADIKQRGLAATGYAEVYFLLQDKVPPSPYNLGRGRLVIRSSGTFPLSVAPLRGLITSVYSNTTVLEVRRLDDVIAESLGLPRFWNIVIGLMAVVAFGLATIGVYGVASSEVDQRRHEFSVRGVLGARPQDIARMVIVGMVAAIAPGIVVGLLLSRLSGPLFASLLFELSPSDPRIFVAAVVALTLAALIGAWMPAHRVSRTDPLTAIKAL